MTRLWLILQAVSAGELDVNTAEKRILALAAGTRQSRDVKQARAEGCQSGPAEQGNAQGPSHEQ